MPQPLSIVLPEGTFVIGNAGDRPLARHPDLAVLALEAIASWSNVEAFMLRLFIKLLGGSGSLAANVYLALDGQSAKTRALKAAAETALDGKSQEREVLDAILGIAKSNEKERNKLAHWVWGDSPRLPDALLLVDPRTKLDALDRARVYVYREADFRKMIEANDRLCGFGQHLAWLLDGHVANDDGSLMRELRDAPEIRQRLAQKRASGEDGDA